MAVRFAVASDHAGIHLRAEVIKALGELGAQVNDLGTKTVDSVDYPDFAVLVAREVVEKRADLGVLVCGTGIGMSIAANKVHGIRAAVCTSEFEARMARAHNDANVLCLGERVTGPGLAGSIVKAFLEQPFEGGRHQRRVDKMTALDNAR